MVISFMKAMLMSRWAFSIALAASAVLMIARDEHLTAGDPARRARRGARSRPRSAPRPPCQPLHRVLAIARVDPLRRVAEKEVDSAAQPRGALERRPHDFLGGAGIDRALEDHDRAHRHRLADGLAGRFNCRQIGHVVAVDRGRHGDDVEVVADQRGLVGGETDGCLRQGLGRYLASAIVTAAQRSNTLGIAVVAGHRTVFGQRHRKRQANVTKADHRDFRCAQSPPPNSSRG